MSELKITKENFMGEVMDSDKPVLVDFWAPWCGYCRMLSSIISEIAEAQEGRVKVGKVNVDEEQELAEQFSIMSIPSVLVFKDGNVIAKTVGIQPKEDLERLLA